MREDKAVVPDVNAQPDIDLSFTADKRATYTIWVRNTATQGSSGNSIFLSISGREYAYTNIAGQPTSFEWSRIGCVGANAGEEASVRIIHRQRNNIVFDKFLITENPLYFPTGIDGAADSNYALPSDTYPAPPVTPPVNEHPRLLFRQSDIPTIKANMSDPKNQAAYTHWQKMLAKTHSGTFSATTTHNNYNSTIIQIAEAKAFDYIINGNEASGYAALSMVNNMADSADFDGYIFPSRAYGHLIATCSKVYDWCYPLLGDNEELRKTSINRIEAYATRMSIGYPPSRLGSVTSHGSEGLLLNALLSFGIAAYDERPDIYNYVAGRLYNDYVAPRNFWYQSHSYHQGSAYVAARFYWDVYASMIMNRMAGIQLFDEENMSKVFYECVYRVRSDGQNFRMGDEYNEYGQKKGVYWNAYGPLFCYGANYFNDGYLLDRYLTVHPYEVSFSDGGGNEGTFSSVQFLIFNKPELERESVSELDKTFYMPSPNGMMIARTGWNYDAANPSNVSDAMALMKIGEMWGGNHNHLDAGSFQLYYKGILASESGYYESYGNTHDAKYNKSSIAHNTITIADPNETLANGYNNGGGQRKPNGGGEASNIDVWFNGQYDTGEVLGYAYGPDTHNPEYSYIKGDVAKAYTSKASEVSRSMLFMPLENDDYPAAFIVFDKVTSADAAYKKSWLLHMQEEPSVNGNRITVTRTNDNYNGKMSVQTLLPKDAQFTTIGGEGQQYVVGGVNIATDNPISSTLPVEAGWGRVEISPAEENETAYFLNVMTVSDADNTAAEIESTLIENDTYAGAAFLDRVCVFMKSRQRNTNGITLDIPGTGSKKVFIGGMDAGRYIVSNSETDTSVLVSATEEGGVLWFDADGGASYSIVKGTSFMHEITSIDVSQTAGSLTVNADITGAVVEGATVIFAAYDGNCLQNVTSRNYNGTGTYQATLTVPTEMTDMSVKVFLWESLSTAKPLARAFNL